MDKRTAWSLKEGDRVWYDGHLWEVKRNHRWQGAALIASDGWCENVSWAHLKKNAPKVKSLEVTNHVAQH